MCCVRRTMATFRTIFFVCILDFIAAQGEHHICVACFTNYYISSVRIRLLQDRIQYYFCSFVFAEYCDANLFPIDPVFVGALGNTYYYSCQGWNAEDNVTVTWYINGDNYSENTADNILLIPPPQASISRKLVIDMVSIENNDTEIYCHVEYSNKRCSSTKSVFRILGDLKLSLLYTILLLVHEVTLHIQT